MEFYTDGRATPNPGDRVISVTDREGKILLTKNIGYGTSNEAEYIAVIEALDIAKKLEVSSVVVYTPSVLLINHMKGVWKISKKFKSLVERVKYKCRDFPKSFIAHKKSKDNLARSAIDRMINGEITEVKVEMSEINQSLVSIPINLNAAVDQKKSSSAFSIMVDYRDDIMNVYVDPDEADLTLVEAVLKAAIVEVSIQRMHETKLKMKKNSKNKPGKYIQ